MRKIMQNGAKEPREQENAAERAISAIQGRKEKPEEAECRTSSGRLGLCECMGVVTRNRTR